MPTKFEAPDQRVQQQLDRFAESGMFRGKQMLRHVLWRLLSPTFAQMIDKGDSNSCAMGDVYKSIYTEKEKPIPEGAGDSGKHVVERLRMELPEYYGKHPDDPVLIEIPIGTFQPTTTYRENAALANPQATKQDAASDARDQLPLAFKEFFGIREAENQPQGVIILQSDRMDDKFGDLIPRLIGDESLKNNKEQRTLRAHEAITLGSRLYKARTWVNKCDAAGAEAIRNLFWANKLNAPHLVFSRRGIPDPARPFQISMGLGFTDRTQRLIEDQEKCGSWLNVNKGKVWGDALYLHENLFPASVRAQFEAQKGQEKVVHLKRLDLYKDADTNEFVRILPHQWKSNYVDLWAKKLDNHNSIELSDYAVILRHTIEDDDATSILFVLAGFTECGTEVAGRYLSANFQKLHERFFQIPDADPVSSLGDFLLIIAGPACPSDDEVKRWRECSDFPAITPKTLQTAGIPCEWSRRFETRL